MLSACSASCTNHATVEPPPATTPAPPAPPRIHHVWKEGPRAAPNAPVLVVLHGMGDRPEGILPVVYDYPGSLQALAPRAPNAYNMGWSWFSGPASLQDAGAFCDEVRAAAARLALDIEALDLDAGGHRQVGVTGFSQGGMLALALAFNHPEVVDVALPMAGHVPGPCMPTGGPPQGAPPIRAFHGDSDDRLPYAAMRDTVDRLTAQGWDIELATYPGVGHQVSRQMQADLFAGIGATLPDATLPETPTP